MLLLQNDVCVDCFILFLENAVFFFIFGYIFVEVYLLNASRIDRLNALFIYSNCIIQLHNNVVFHFGVDM